MLFNAAVAVFGLSVATAASSSAAKAKPECVDKCWTNSQYVSLCQGNHQCLCDDSEFQNAVYQCLYSQCATSKFGTALHHALQACHVQEDAHSEEGVFDIMPVDDSGEAPAMLQFDDSLKRRGAKSVSASHSATRSATKSATKSASVSKEHTYPTGRARPEHSVSASKSVTRPVRSVTKSAHGSKSVTHSARPTHSVTKSVSRPGKSVTKSAHHSVSKSVTKSAHHSVTKSAHHSVTKSVKPSKSVTKSAHHSVTKSAKPSKSVTKSSEPSKSVTKSSKPSKSVTKSSKPSKSVTKSASASAFRRV